MTDPITDFQALIRWAHGWPLDDDIERALREDLGRRRHDVTSEALIDKQTTGQATLIAREPGVTCGIVLIREVVLHASAHLDTELHVSDGDAITTGAHLATFTGTLRDILRVERTVLNYLTHLSGIATLTRQYTDAIAGTGAVVCDTRKTLPGLRWLQKYAVKCGGGTTHRLGLHDAVLIKDNHIAHIPPDELAQRIAEAVERAHKKQVLLKKPRPLKFIMVEVDTLDQLERVLPAPIDFVLLDNMPPDVLRQAVEMRDKRAPKVKLEASGGITLETIRAVAESGVDRISVGALTHSAASLDIGLDIAPAPGSDAGDSPGAAG